MLWVGISVKARCTTLCDKIRQLLATGRWFSPGTPVSSTNKTDHHDINEILLKVVLNTIKQTNIINWMIYELRVTRLPIIDRLSMLWHSGNRQIITWKRCIENHFRETTELNVCILTVWYFYFILSLKFKNISGNFL